MIRRDYVSRQQIPLRKRTEIPKRTYVTKKLERIEKPSDFRELSSLQVILDYLRAREERVCWALPRRYTVILGRRTPGFPYGIRKRGVGMADAPLFRGRRDEPGGALQMV
jgi:hypothetical protein